MTVLKFARRGPSVTRYMSLEWKAVTNITMFSLGESHEMQPRVTNNCIGLSSIQFNSMAPDDGAGHIFAFQPNREGREGLCAEGGRKLKHN